jgi:hypothetical protein
LNREEVERENMIEHVRSSQEAHQKAVILSREMSDKLTMAELMKRCMQCRSLKSLSDTRPGIVDDPAIDAVQIRGGWAINTFKSSVSSYHRSQVSRLGCRVTDD